MGSAERAESGAGLVSTAVVRKAEQLKETSQQWDAVLAEYATKKARLDKLAKMVEIVGARIKAYIEAAGPIDTLQWLAVISETPVKEHRIAAHVRRTLRVARKA